MTGDRQMCTVLSGHIGYHHQCHMIEQAGLCGKTSPNYEFGLGLWCCGTDLPRTSYPGEKCLCMLVCLDMTPASTCVQGECCEPTAVAVELLFPCHGLLIHLTQKHKARQSKATQAKQHQVAGAVDNTTGEILHIVLMHFQSGLPPWVLKIRELRHRYQEDVSP